MIAKQLDAAGVAGSGGHGWRDTTIRGRRDRGTGILSNSLSMPGGSRGTAARTSRTRTGKRVARPNPHGQWEIGPVTELRIVDDDLWAAVKARRRFGS